MVKIFLKKIWFMHRCSAGGRIAMGLTRGLSPQTLKILPMYITGIVFVVVNIIFDPTVFYSWDRICTVALQFAPLILCSMAQTCVLLTGGIDLSLGVSLSLMTAILSTTMKDGFGGTLPSLILTLGSGALVGFMMGSVVTFARIPAIIVTLAFSYIWKGVTLYILPVPGGYIPRGFTRFMSGRYIVPGAGLVILASLLLWKFIKNARIGIALYAIGDNPRVAYENGINVNRTRLFAYCLSGIFIAIAGMLLVGQTGSGDPNIGRSYQMNSIAAPVLGGVAFSGGIGQMRGAVIGAFIIGSLINILFFSGVSPFYQYVAQGIILIFVIGLKAIDYYRKGGEK
jgi:ribose transport system permease protein